MDQIFTHFIGRGDEHDERRLAFAMWFTDNIPMFEFSGDEKLMWNYLEYSSRIGAPICRKYLQVWIDTELRHVLRETEARVQGCETLRFEDPVSFETIYRTASDVLLDDFTVLESLEANVEDFPIVMSAYMSRRRSERMTEALSETMEVLNRTDSSNEAADYVLNTVNSINDIYDPTLLEDLDYTDIRRENLEFITDSGIPAIDNDSQGIFSSQLVGIEAQPGTGKTRFSIGTWCYRAVTLYHRNVLFLAGEQKEVEVEAMFVARHVYEMYHIQISDRLIWTNTVPEEYKAQVEAARYDLFESGKYGVLKIKEKTLYVETFITKLRTWDKLWGPFHLICIDYMGLFESRPAKYTKSKLRYEIIIDAYKLFKRYLRRTNKAGIAVAQLNGDGIKAGENDKVIDDTMADGGPGVYRNTDYNVALTMTPTMRVQQKRRVSQPKVRSSAGFGRFMLNTRLGFCWFKQIVQQKV